ncbi:MAG: hypothetical protein JSR82_09400 [Verrucomicrobia bacterium]|nr:hypothetical protein [Verrucomicrobiota bacterium]
MIKRILLTATALLTLAGFTASTAVAADEAKPAAEKKAKKGKKKGGKKAKKAAKKADAAK